MISIKGLDSSLTKIDKKSYKNIVICNTRYIIIKNIDDDENINSVNTLYIYSLVKQINISKKSMQSNI